jgi:hypothetical protein
VFYSCHNHAIGGVCGTPRQMSPVREAVRGCHALMRFFLVHRRANPPVAVRWAGFRLRTKACEQRTIGASRFAAPLPPSPARRSERLVSSRPRWLTGRSNATGADGVATVLPKMSGGFRSPKRKHHPTGGRPG